MDINTQVKIISDLMNNITYGWLDIDGQKNEHLGEYFCEHYFLRSAEQIISDGFGICWDQVELERYYFSKNNIDCETYFLVCYDDKNDPSHTFLVFESDNKYYWFEHSYGKYKGIHEYRSKNELLLDVRDKFINDDNHKEMLKNENRPFMYKYLQPKTGINTIDFYKHCANGEVISLD